MEYLEFTFNKLNEDKAEILIAILSNIGFDGFQQEEDILKAFIPADKFDQNLFESINELNGIKYSKSIIKEQNWNTVWEADFEPVKVNSAISGEPFVYIRANFHAEDNMYPYNIEVTPKMSFGTGHHATTYMMVANMHDIDFANKSVIDFGTGTGVLAILAEKLGAKNVIAIDNDEWSINNAQENVSVNNCTKINLIKAETIASQYKGDIILANINLNIITDNIDAIVNAAGQNAVFLFSGIMLHDENNIVKVLTDADMNIKSINKQDNWLSVIAEKTN